jgi:methanogenic corrinoid protein MtbC1
MDRTPNGEIEKRLISALGELDEARVLDCARRLLDGGADRFLILELLKEGLAVVGDLYEKGEYFIADLIVSGSIYKAVLELPQMQYRPEAGRPILGRVVIGTVEGDVHDIGKDLVRSVLSANGFEVVDLGTDVPPAVFISALREHRPDILALSGVLTLAVTSMARTIEAVAEAGYRDRVRIIVGGMCLSEELGRSIGADAYAKDPFAGLVACKLLLRENRKGESDGDPRVL